MALKAAQVEAVQQLQRQHDAELDEVQLQSVEDVMQDMMTKVHIQMLSVPHFHRRLGAHALSQLRHSTDNPALHPETGTAVLTLLRSINSLLALQVSRLQAAIAEAAAQVGITVSWCPPSFANSGLQEEFEEMGAWLSRISDTLHQLCRERRRLMVCGACLMCLCQGLLMPGCVAVACIS